MCFSRGGAVEVGRNGLHSGNIEEVGFRGFGNELDVGKVARHSK